MWAVIEWESGRQEVVEKNPSTVGRSGDVRVVSDGVSRKHAELRFKGEGIGLVDLGSTNGTLIGGQRAETGIEVPVGWGEEIRFGGSGVSFRLLKPESRDPDTDLEVLKALRVVEPESEEPLETVSHEVQKARRGRRPGLTLSERDLDVLEWIAEHRWSTRELLVEALYSAPNPEKMRAGVEASGKYGRERVAKLERAGFIHPSFIKIGTTVPLLLTPKGYDILHGQGRAEWAHPFPDIDASRFSHEILLQRLHISLVKLGATSWLSERRLSQLNRRNGLPYVPDARFEAGGRKFALEFERTLKAKKRLHAFLEVRAKSNQQTKMLYVLPEQLVVPFKKAISDSWSQFAPGLYVLMEEDFVSGKKPLTVQCLNSQWQKMKLADLLSGGPEPAEVAASTQKADQLKREREFQASKQRMRAAIEEMVLDFRAQRNTFSEVMKVNAEGKDKLLFRKKPLPKLQLPKRWAEVMRWAQIAQELGSVAPVSAFREWAEQGISRLNWEIDRDAEISKNLLSSPSSQALLDWVKQG